LNRSISSVKNRLYRHHSPGFLIGFTANHACWRTDPGGRRAHSQFLGNAIHEEWTLNTKLILSAIAIAVGSAGWVNAANAALSATRPVIAILGGDIYVGSAVGHLNGSGTLSVHSQADPTITCSGEFTSSAKLGGAGQLRCNDGATSTFQFKRLDAFRGHGGGTFSRGSMSFTYGLSVDQSAQYLSVPPGKKISRQGEVLALVDS
jgi:hypothetical protein